LPTTLDQSHSEDFDDYVVECDEHLAAARRSLLDLEAAGEPSTAGRDSLDALFRAFHTIKGLSGMVGVRAAEEAAHFLESYLTAVRNGDVFLTEGGVNVLLDGIVLIENAIAARRSNGSEPDVSFLAAQIAALSPEHSDRTKRTVAAPPAAPTSFGADEPATAGIPAEKQAQIDDALRRGARAWRVFFTPGPELSARGINVGVVRARLTAAGEIVHAEPVPSPGGVQFRFVLVADANAEVQSLRSDGVSLEPYHSPPPQPSPPPSSHPVGIAPANLVRVDLRRLDDLMRSLGELVLSRARLERGLARVAAHLPLRERRDLEETAQAIERQLRELREGVMRVRMVPVRDLFARMRLVARDLTRETRKDVDLLLEGEQTEVDKFVVERLADPLLHLVRNAVSHGLEPPEERTAAGKPPKGRITLRASTSGGMIILDVEDDGRGVNVDEVFARAREAGLVAPETPADPAAVLDLLCTHGFSTRDGADRASGRGVGMDVVRLAVEGLGGTLTLTTRPGFGSRFTARLPLTLAIADVLTVKVGGHVYAVPQTAVREVVPIEPGATTIFENNELVRYHDRAIPLLWLGDVFGLPRPVGPFVALVTGENGGTLALAADRAIDLREVVVRALADPLVQVAGIGGATELGDGRPILILDPVGLGRVARRRAVNVATGIGG
jgi:two-component system chemotaxis sensor kinase CheA